MWLIVGLGNPGPQYTWTPHNLGFHVIDRIVEHSTQADETTVQKRRIWSNYVLKRRREAALKYDDFVANSYVWRRVIDNEEVVLARPQTFMNTSGVAVVGLMRRFSTALQKLIVVFDDVAIPWGVLRLRLKGSAGGHNGMRSVIERVGSDEFVRVRIGVKPDFAVGDLATYVLSPMPSAWRQAVPTVVDFAAEAAESVVGQGPVLAMTRYSNKTLPI